MEIAKIKTQRLYKNSVGGRIMVRLSLFKGEGDSAMNRLYESLAERYFTLAKNFIDSRADDRSTYFLDVICDKCDGGENIKIKRSSTLRCGASLIKKEDVFDVFDSSLKEIKK